MFPTMTTTLITAASANHFAPLQRLLYTLAKFEPKLHVVVWDLGLDAAQRQQLTGDVRTFDFSPYPPYFDLAKNAGRMGFRPVCLAAAAKEFGGVIVWMDAGNLLMGGLYHFARFVTRVGAWSPVTQGQVGRKLAPSSAGALGVTDAIASAPLLDAGLCAFDTVNPSAVALLSAWRAAALNPAIADPAGADRYAHRQDAVFTALFHLTGIVWKPWRVPVWMHQDMTNLDGLKWLLREPLKPVHAQPIFAPKHPPTSATSRPPAGAGHPVGDRAAH